MIQLVLKNLTRHKLRLTLTIIGIAVIILAFSLLRTVIAAWYIGIEGASSVRLVSRNATSLVFDLPLSYADKMRTVPGVAHLSYANWFGGLYIDERHSMFPQFAVEGTTWFTVYPELIVSEEQKQTFLHEKNAAIVGKKLLDQNGWKIGDTISMKGMIYPGEWDFVIRGVYTGAKPATDETWFLFRWDYFNEHLHQLDATRSDHVGFYVMQIADPKRAGEISRAVDQQFANSIAETLTETERAFQAEFLSMMSALLIALKTVSFLVIGVMLAILANTMAMSARERLVEYAVFKTIGFRARHICFLILGESLIIAMAGGLLGMLFSYPAAELFESVLVNMAGAFFPYFKVSHETLLLCLLLSIGIGFFAAIYPCWKGSNQTIADGLRRIG